VNAACTGKDESPGRRVPGLFSRSVATRGSKQLDGLSFFIASASRLSKVAGLVIVGF
jgi:hypothetical protein